MTLHIAYYKGRKSDNPQTHWLDRLICWATNSPHSHCELVINYSPESERGVCWSSSPRDGGVRRTSIKLSPPHWEVYRLNTSVTAHDVEEWFTPLDGLKYDYLGAIGARFPSIPGIKRRWFCSEIVCACLFRDNIVQHDQYSPGELYNFLEKLNMHRVP